MNQTCVECPASLVCMTSHVRVRRCHQCEALGLLEYEGLDPDRFVFRAIDEFVVRNLKLACPNVSSECRYLCTGCASNIFVAYTVGTFMGKEQRRDLESQFHHSRLKIALFPEVSRTWKGPASLPFELWEALK